jgi:hypothetical protein
MNKPVYLACYFSVLISNISYFSYLQPTYVGWLFNATFILAVFILLPNIYSRADASEKNYIFLMLVGFALHLAIPDISNRVSDVTKWILPVILLMAARKYKSKTFEYFLLAVFVTHCLVAIEEYVTQQYFVDYFYTEEFGKYYEAHSQFRAFGLMAHPLYGASVTLIVMSFLLVSKAINSYVKIGLIALGSYALVCFNSRAAMIIWGALLLYRLFFYRRRPIIAISLGVLVYLFSLSDLFALLLQSTSGFLGRLGEANNLADSSTSARLVSFAVFAAQEWNLYDIVAGGRIFYLPGTTVSLENGLLLTIAWWGWIVGLLKVLLELTISWKCLKNYDARDKFIILIATWVCAYANNNTINSFVFAFFIICFVSINYYPSLHQARKYSYRHAMQ